MYKKGENTLLNGNASRNLELLDLFVQSLEIVVREKAHAV